MARRTVYGNQFSENGWPIVDTQSCEWVSIPGCNPAVHIQVQKGQPSQVLRAFMADWNQFLEPLRDADTACWTATNSVGNSCHLSGTSVDGNWNSHPFHVSYAGFDDAKVLAMRDMLKFYTEDGLPLVYWGQDWGMQGIGPFDCMHLEMAPNTYNNPKTAAWIARNIRADGFSTYKRGPMTAPDTAVLAAATREKVLPFVHSQQLVAQEKPWDCGPASVQIILSSLGINMSEDDLIRALHTTTDGTSSAEAALPILNEKTAGKYVASWLPNDPPRPDQVEKLWHDCVGSISAGYGVLVNFELTSAHFPRGERGSFTPQWRGAKVWHFLACMGFADDGGGKRYLGISDPGFPPFDQGVFWMSVEAVASAITPHCYAYSTVAPAAAAPPPAKPAPIPTQIPPAQAPVPTAVLAAATVPNTALDEFWSEWAAIELGDQDSIMRVLRTAAGKSGGSPEVVHRARAVLARVSRPALTAALSAVEPDVLTALTGRIA